MTSRFTLWKTIVKTYFLNSHCLVWISHGSTDISLNLPVPLLILNLDNYQNIENIFDYAGCKNFLLDVKRPVSVFTTIEQQIKLHQDRFNQRSYIFFTTKNKANSEDVFKIFDTQESNFVTDVTIALSEETIETKPNNKSKFSLSEGSQVVSLWTHRYTGKTGNSHPYLLDKWFSENGSFLHNANLFPNKLSDQQGRILKVAVFSYEPYVIIEPQEKNKSYLYLGSEMRILETFAKYINATIMPVINEVDYWGEIWTNWSGSGLMGNLVEDRADIGAGIYIYSKLHIATALYTWEFAYEFLDLSKPTVRTGITCLVPAPKLSDGWLTPIRVYSYETWLALIATFVLSLASLYAFNIFQIEATQLLKSPNDQKGCFNEPKSKLFSKTLMSVLKPFVMQSITNIEMSKGRMAKYMMGLVFLATLVLRTEAVKCIILNEPTKPDYNRFPINQTTAGAISSTTFDSGLATIMTVPRYDKPINTVEDLVKSGLHWVATQDAWVTSIQDSKEPDLMKLVSRFTAHSEETLRKYSLSDQFAFGVERLPNVCLNDLGNYAIGTYIQEDVIQKYHLMTYDIYWEMCVLMMRKNSVLLPEIDKFVLRVFEAGLISFWQNEAASQYMDQTVQTAVRYYYNNKEKDIVKLKMIHVQGVFAILVFGNIISLVAFLVELLHYKLATNKLIEKQ